MRIFLSFLGFLNRIFKQSVQYRFPFSIFLFLAFIFSFSLPIQGEVANAASVVPVVVRPAVDSYFLTSVNSIRASQHLKPLMIDDRLDESAHNKNIDMINNNYWDHVAPSELRFSDFIWSKSPKAARVGENLARCFKSEPEAMQAFINSPTHYANIIGDYSAVGVSETIDPTTQCSYITMHFASYK